MKPARLLFIILGILLALVALAGGLALTPAVQRWAVGRVLRAEPGLRFEATTIAAGFTHLRLGGVVVEKNGLSVKLERLEADYSPWQLLFNGRLQVGHLSAVGLLVDASRLSRAKTQATVAGAPVATPGLLGRMSLPFELVLDDCLIEGRALLPGGPGQPPIPAEYRVTGGKFSPGKEGALVLAATLRSPRPSDGGVVALHAGATLRARQTSQKTFSRVSLTAVVDAEGRHLSGQDQLKVTASLENGATGETYDASVDTLLHGLAEKMLALHATLPADRGEYAGEWQLLARTAQLEPFFLGAGLPDFNARGEGRFTFNPATAAGSLQGQLTADVSRLEALEPAWRAIGAVKATARFDLAAADGVARLNHLEVAVAGQQPVLELSAARAAEINFKERRLQVGGSASGEALTLTLHGLPLAWVRPFVQAVDVSGGLITGQLAVTGEIDRLRLRTLQPLRVAPLTIVQAGRVLLAKADVALGFEAVLTAQEVVATVTDFTLKTPAGDLVAAQAKVILPVLPEPAMTITAAFKADLPALLAPWLSLGHIRGVGEVDFTLMGRRTELRRLQAGVTDATGLDLLQVIALQAFTLDRETLQATTTAGTGSVDLLRLVVGRVPLAALRLTNPGTVIGGHVAQGEFILTAEGEKLAIRAPVPLRLTEVSLTEQGAPVLSDLRIEAQPRLELGGGLRLQSGEVTVRASTGAELATFTAEAAGSGRTRLTGLATFRLEVPALATQPLFAGAQAVSAGRASGEVRLAFGPVQQVEARLTLNGLVGAVGGQTLPVANLGFRAIAQPDGRISVQAPLLLDHGGERSDLNLALELTPAGRGFVLDGNLTGEHVELADALAVAGVFLTTVAPAERSPGPTEPALRGLVSADPVPVWSRFAGRLKLDVKSVVRGTDWAMTGLTGLAVLEPAQLRLERLEAVFGEKGRLTAKTEINFTGGARPYALSGDFALTEFDAGRLFKALDPGRPAAVEGVFSINGRFIGNGETLDRAFERSLGEYALTSRQGIFRGLQRTSNKISMTSKAVELSATVLGSIFGSEKATKTAEKVAGQAYFIDQLAQSIGEFNYDQLSVKLTRNESLNVTLDDISLVSPEIRLIGRGTVTHVAGQPLLAQPLSAAVTISSRGKTEELFGKLRLLSGTRDELGYARSKETVTLGGTLLRPDPTAFFTRIAAAKLNELLAPEN